MTPPQEPDEPMYPISEKELNQIKNDCAYPDQESCDGCPLADGEDESRASGLGCNFKGANVLMDEILARPNTGASSQQRIDAAIKELEKTAGKLSKCGQANLAAEVVGAIALLQEGRK